MQYFRESIIISLFFKFSDLIYKLIKNSLVYHFCCSYDKTELLYQNSFFGFWTSKLASMRKHWQNAKITFASFCEKSVIINFFCNIARGMLANSLRNYGKGFLFFGLFSASIHLIKYYALEQGIRLLTLDFVLSVVIFVLSLLLLPYKKPVSEVLAESRIMSYLLFDFFTYSKNDMRSIKASGKYYPVITVVGMLCGILTYFVSPLYFVIGFFAVIGLFMLIKNPETGLLLTFLALPFTPTMLLAGLIIFTFTVYLLKLARGKRVLKITFLDLMVLLFMFILLFGGIFSAGGKGSLPPALIFVCFLLSYFLVVNMIRSVSLVKKCALCITVSLFFVSIYGIYQNFFYTSNASWLDQQMFSDIKSRVVSTFENPNVLGEYLITILPLVLSMILMTTAIRQKTASFIVLCAASVCLVFTWSRGAWLGLVFGLLLFVVLCGKQTMYLISLGILSIPFLPFILPESIIKRFTSIGNIADTSTLYRVSIWKATAQMIQDYLFGGIGIGEKAFGKIYPAYTFAGIEAAPHSHNLYMQIATEMGIFAVIIFLVLLFLIFQMTVSFASDREGAEPSMRFLSIGAISGIFAISVQGFTDYTWYNYRVYLMFWLMFGLCAAAIRSSKTEYIPKGADRLYNQ